VGAHDPGESVLVARLERRHEAPVVEGLQGLWLHGHLGKSSPLRSNTYDVAVLDPYLDFSAEASSCLTVAPTRARCMGLSPRIRPPPTVYVVATDGKRFQNDAPWSPALARGYP